MAQVIDTIAISLFIHGATNGSFGDLGRYFMIPFLVGSMVRAKLGNPSEIRLIQSICAAENGKGYPNPSDIVIAKISSKASDMR